MGMAAIIKDLGITDFNGRLSRARHYYTVQCKVCQSTELTLRDDSLHQDTCKSCKKDLAKKEAATKLTKGTQTCTHCKEEKPFKDFSKHRSALGFRSKCKACRSKDEAETNEKYRHTEKGKVVSTNTRNKRRARIKSTDDGTVTTEFLMDLRTKQNHQCHYCNEKLDYLTPRATHLDHVIPLSKGGTHTQNNVVWSCSFCNLSKGDKLT